MARTLLHWKGVVLDSVLEIGRGQGCLGNGPRHTLGAMKSLQAQLFKLTLEAPKEPARRLCATGAAAGQTQQ